ncbi:MAG: hypothetical protein J5651_04235 [Salinivirgaceae bacterium]|nr:hypothetical protein [Salinivirgaceae bacterium]MBO7432461.1 hypothetical protein [Salinivirgaceae bacterium]
MFATLILTLILVGIALIGLSFNLIFRKKPFPETHISHNKDMKKLGIMCVKAMDALEQKKAKENSKNKYDNLQIIKNEN